MLLIFSRLCSDQVQYSLQLTRTLNSEKFILPSEQSPVQTLLIGGHLLSPDRSTVL